MPLGTAVTALALKGLASAVGGTIGNVADRGLQAIMQRVRDRVAGMREAPEGLIVARTIRLAQMQALERVVREYEESLRIPRALRARNTNSFIEKALAFSGSRSSLSVDDNGSLDVASSAPAIVAANAAISLPVAEGSPADREARLTTAADDAVLEELGERVAPQGFPRGFEEHFRQGRRGRRSFSALFGSYLEEQLKTNEPFHRVYSTALLADIRQIVAGTRDAVALVETGVAAIRHDLRLGVADAATQLGLGDTLNFSTTVNYFGRRLEPGATFNHARPLAGREQLVTRFVERTRELLSTPGPGIVSISAIGGAGKSRLLIEVARRLESDASVRWVRDGVDVAFDALSQLPAGPVVLICDDAQRRSDLTTVLRIADARRAPTVVLISTRPYGKEALQASMYGANISFDRLRDLGELPDVSTDELVPVVEAELGIEHRALARDLLRLAGDSILVALVAARLLRSRQLDPRGIIHDPEFRTTVLEGFRQEAIGALPGNLNAETARRLLEALAAVQPISLEDEALEAGIARHVDATVSDLRRVLAALTDGGVVRGDRTGLRIVPDVLGDHILNRAMVARGRPTSLDAEILEGLGDGILVNLVRNVGELDWQRNVAGQPIPVFDGVWASFTSTFFEAPNWRRAEWLGRLHPVAAFQPKAMLKLAQQFFEDPRGDDRRSGLFNVRTSDAEVVAKLPELLSIIAQHHDHVVEALDLLWAIGQTDNRATNSYPEHAMRQLADVVAYSRRRHLWMQERALDALEGWVAEPSWSSAAHSPLLVAAAVLETSMEEHTYNDRESSVTLTRYGVHPENTRGLRLRAIGLLEALVMRSDVRGRHLALNQLLDALHTPDAKFGHQVTVEEEESFREQYSAALDAVERIVNRGVDALALVTIRTDLHQAARFSLLEWKSERMRTIASGITDTPAIRLVLALGYPARDWDPERMPYRDYEAQWISERNATADDVVREAGGVTAAGQTLSDACALYDTAGKDYEPGSLLSAIAVRHPDFARDLAWWALETVSAGAGKSRWLAPILSALRETRPDDYSELLRSVAASNVKVVRVAGASALARVQGPSRRSDLELSIVRQLLADEEIDVVGTALIGMWYMDLDQVIALLPLVRLHGSAWAAERLAEAWTMRRGEPGPEPDEATTRHLLQELVEVKRFGQAEWDVSRLLAALAKRHPDAVIDFLTARVERERAERLDHEDFDPLRERYDAIPYQGFDGLQEGLRAS